MYTLKEEMDVDRPVIKAKVPRILMILHLPPPVHGAAVVGQYIKKSKLINEAFEIDYINLSTSATLTEIGKGGWKKFISSMRLVGRVAKALTRKKYDLCYMTLTAAGSGFYKDMLIVSLLKAARKKIVYHFHNKGVCDRQSRVIDHRLYQFAFANTHSVLLSPVLYRDIQKYVPQHDVFYCANGIPCKPERQQFFRKRSENPGVCKILFLSHMMHEKGVVVLLDACKFLVDNGHEFECNFVGAWSNITESAFNELVNERGIANYVKAHGPRFDEQKERFFTEADIFVLPTYYKAECFSLVLLEAMSFALPIVSTNEGAIPDMVRNEITGYVVQKHDSRELALRLATLIEDPDLRIKYGNAGKRRFLESYTLSEFERTMYTIFSDLTIDGKTQARRLYFHKHLREGNIAASNL